MADARLTVAQLADILRRLDDIATHTQFARDVILEAMARRTRARESTVASVVSARSNRRAPRRIRRVRR